MPPRHPDARVAEARRLYEEGVLSEADIEARTGMPRGTFRARATREGWVRPHAPTRAAAIRAADRVSLVARLFRSFERQIADLERRFSAEGESDERDARMLAVLAKTFETLNGLKAEEDRKKDDAVDLERLRAELAARLGSLVPGGQGDSGGAGREPGEPDRGAEPG